MKAKRYAAIDLLMSYPDATVAEMLGVKMSTLRRWMQMEDFQKVLKERERERRACLNRIVWQAAVNTASNLCRVTGENMKPDVKALLEVLKLCTELDTDCTDPGEALAEVIRQAAAMEAAYGN